MSPVGVAEERKAPGGEPAAEAAEAAAASDADGW